MTEPQPPELLRDLDRATGWTLMVEGAEQSYVDVDDPTHLEFEYMQHIALVVDLLLPPPAPLSALHLGGGALTLPRWVAATRPRSTQVVVESSALILEAVRPLGDVAGCKVLHADALTELAAAPSGGDDLVVWDLYDGPRVATDTLTLGSVQQMRRVLRAGGVAILNVSDATPFDLVRPVAVAVRMTFDDVAVVAEPSTLRGRRSGNCLVVGTTRRLPTVDLRRALAAAPVRGRAIVDEDLAAFCGDARPPTEDAPLPLPDETVGRGFL